MASLREMPWVLKRLANCVVIPWSRLVPPSKTKYGNARKDGLTTETFAERANSLILEGQKNPLTGYLSDDGESFELIDGEIRHGGYVHARDVLGVDFDKGLHGVDGVKVVVGPRPGNKNLDTVGVAYFQIGCGTDTLPLSQLDKAIKIKELVELHGQKVSDVAKHLGCSDQHVRDMVKLASVDDGMKTAIREKKISPTTATRVTKATEEAQREVKEKLDRGEKVKGTDVDRDEPKVLSREEIEKQIKKADKLFCCSKTDKDRHYYKGVYTGLQITISAAEKL